MFAELYRRFEFQLGLAACGIALVAMGKLAQIVDQGCYLSIDTARNDWVARGGCVVSWNNFHLRVRLSPHYFLSARSNGSEFTTVAAAWNNATGNHAIFYSYDQRDDDYCLRNPKIGPCSLP